MDFPEEARAQIHAGAEQAQALVRDIFAQLHGRPANKAELEAWRVGFEMGMEGTLAALKQMLDDGILVAGNVPE